MAKFTGKGGQFLIKSSAATPAYVAVGQVSEIGEIGVTADEIDVTTLDAGDYRDFIQGFKDAGECSLSVIFDPGLDDQGDGPDGLLGLFASGATRDVAIRVNSSATAGEAFLLFKAFIRDMSYGAINPDDPQKLTPVFRISGAITIEDVLPTTLAEGEGEGAPLQKAA